MTKVNEIYTHHLVDRRWATTFLGTGKRIRTLFLGIKIGAVAEETRAKHEPSASWQRQRACYDARLGHVSVAATRVDFLTFFIR